MARFDRRRRSIHAALAAWLTTSIVACFGTHGCRAGSPGCPDYATPKKIGEVTSDALVENSGLAASRAHTGVIWAHNDSGDSARVFALNTSGTLLGTYSLSGATHIDYEDMAIGAGPSRGVDYLYIGDIGDNANLRSNIVVYRVVEPSVSADQSPVTTTLMSVDSITLEYPDGPRDAETLMIDTNGDMYIVSKRVTDLGRVYRAPFPHSTTETITLEFVAELPWGDASGFAGATGGDIAADGSAVIVRRYVIFNPPATMWLRPRGTDLADVFKQPGCTVPMPAELQGEAVAFIPAGLSYYTIGEGATPPVFFTEAETDPADLTGDGVVGPADLAIVLGSWGACPMGKKPSDCDADLTGDLVVGPADLAIVLGGWG